MIKLIQEDEEGKEIVKVGRSLGEKSLKERCLLVN